jgi:ribonuclease P protein component
VAEATGVAAGAAAASVPSLRFPPQRRLRRPAEFKRAYAQGRRLGNEFFTVNALPNGLSIPRLGMSVAARNLKHAVARNRIRRLIRESFRAHSASLPAFDLVIGVRAAVLGAESARVRERLETLWHKIAALCES